jgi:hypothetical protein
MLKYPETHKPTVNMAPSNKVRPKTLPASESDWQYAWAQKLKFNDKSLGQTVERIFKEFRISHGDPLVTPKG